jgi:hypothetical protein
MNTAHPAVAPIPGLCSLSTLPLDRLHEGLFHLACKTCAGPTASRLRFQAEARELLALAQLSRRLRLHSLDLSCGLRAEVELTAPVPCLPDPTKPLRVASRALLGLLYPQEAIFTPQPGYVFVRLLHPWGIWHSNVSPDHNQVLCLGPSLPAGIPLKEIVLMTYGALTLQTIQIDRLDPAGVLNPAAGDWWQQNSRLIPLTHEPFLPAEAKHAA